METLRLKLSGTRPLLMHNIRMADPACPYARRLKELTSIRKKTAEIIEDMKTVEWHGSLYTDADGTRPVIPSDVVLGVLVSGAKKSKLGKLTKAAVFDADDCFALEYDGPKDIEALYADKRFVDYRSAGVNAARVMRCRPIFSRWAVEVAVNVDTSVMEVAQVVRAFEDGGQLDGMGDYRPRHGRFDVEVLGNGRAA